MFSPRVWEATATRTIFRCFILPTARGNQVRQLKPELTVLLTALLNAAFPPTAQWEALGLGVGLRWGTRVGVCWGHLPDRKAGGSVLSGPRGAEGSAFQRTSSCPCFVAQSTPLLKGNNWLSI